MSMRNEYGKLENQYLEDSSLEDMLYESGDLEDYELGEVDPEGYLYEDGTFEGGAYEDGLQESDLYGSYESLDGEADYFSLKKLRKLTKPFKPLLVKAAGKAAGSFLPGSEKLAQRLAGKLLQEMEMEMEADPEALGESEPEWQYEIDPEIMLEMSGMAQLIAETDNLQESDLFLGAIGNAAMSALSGFLNESEPKTSLYEQDANQFLPALLPIAKALAPIALPWIKRGVKAIGRELLKESNDPEIAYALPEIAVGAAYEVARSMQQAQQPSKKQVVASVTKAAVRTLGNPQRARRAILLGKLRAYVARRHPNLNPQQKAQMVRQLHVRYTRRMMNNGTRPRRMV